MKYAPKKVFILENGKFSEITYEELLLREKQDSSYKDKLFLPMYGVLIEVSEKNYKEYYRIRRRQKYIDECSRENGEFSYDSLDTEEMNGEEILVDRTIDVAEQAEKSIMTDKLRNILSLLSDEERRLINEIYFEEQTERDLAKKYHMSQVAIHKRKTKILEKLKKFLEN